VRLHWVATEWRYSHCSLIEAPVESIPCYQWRNFVAPQSFLPGISVPFRHRHCSLGRAVSSRVPRRGNIVRVRDPVAVYTRPLGSCLWSVPQNQLQPLHHRLRLKPSGQAWLGSCLRAVGLHCISCTTKMSSPLHRCSPDLLQKVVNGELVGPVDTHCPRSSPEERFRSSLAEFHTKVDRALSTMRCIPNSGASRKHPFTRKSVVTLRQLGGN